MIKATTIDRVNRAERLLQQAAQQPKMRPEESTLLYQAGVLLARWRILYGAPPQTAAGWRESHT